MKRQNIKLVKLLNPSLCDDCPFRSVAQVKTQDGEWKSVTYCRRKDCDNWDYSSIEDIADFTPPPETTDRYGRNTE